MSANQQIPKIIAKSMIALIQRQPIQRTLFQERKTQERAKGTQRNTQRKTVKAQTAKRQEESDVSRPQPQPSEQYSVFHSQKRFSDSSRTPTSKSICTKNRSKC